MLCFVLSPLGLAWPPALAALFGASGLEAMNLLEVAARLAPECLAAADRLERAHLLGGTLEGGETWGRVEGPTRRGRSGEEEGAAQKLSNWLDSLARPNAPPAAPPGTQTGELGQGPGQGAAGRGASRHRVKCSVVLERDARQPKAEASLRPIGGLDACARGDLSDLEALVGDLSDPALANPQGRSLGGGGGAAVGVGWDPRFACCKAGSSALMWAASGGHVHVMDWIAQTAKALDDRDGVGAATPTANGGGGHGGWPDQTTSFALGGVDVNSRNDSGRTAAMFAAKYGRLGALKWLVEARGADLLASSEDGSTAFHWACYSAHLPTIEFVAEAMQRQRRREAAPGEGLGGGKEQVEGGVGQGSPSEVGGRDEQGACEEHPMFWKNRFGCDATHWAAARGSVEVLAWLRERGFDLGAANSSAHKAMDKARYKGHLAAIDWLSALPENAQKPGK